MPSYNRVILVGNITRDIEVKYTPGGTAVAEIGLGINRNWTDRQTNQKKEEVTFVDITLWGRTAEIAGEYLGKGSPVLIEGRLQLDQWEDKQSGQKRSKLRVVGEQLQMLGSRDSGGNRNGGGNRHQQGYQGQSELPPAPNDSYYNPGDGQVVYGDDDTPF